jgi:DNA-binding response OmpR family regulator
MKKNILLVEDDQDLQTILGYNFEKAGFAVNSIGNGADALAWLRENKAELIILDLMLPGLHGSELFARLRAEGKLTDTPVIVTTALADEDTKRRSYQLGASMVFRKPLSPTRLVKHAISALAGIRHPADLTLADA